MHGKTWIVLGIALVALVLLAVVTVWAGPLGGPSEPQSGAAALGTGFTYQGQLKSGGETVTDDCELAFRLYDAETDGTAIGSPITVSKTISDGLFTVDLDFGADAFTGDARWLDIQVQCMGDAGFADLGRQALRASPYALHARSTGALQGHPVTATAPTAGQVLRWSGTAWEPATTASSNQPPVAILEAAPSVLYLGEANTGTVTLSLKASYDPGGEDLTYAFDPTGRALGTPSASSYGSNGTFSAVYSDTGDYLAAGWVRDASATVARAQALVSVYRFGGTILDASADSGSYASLAVVNGRPAIAYREGSLDDLKYVRALDADGSSWGVAVTVDSYKLVGPYASLALVDGHPAIAYAQYDVTSNYDLRYARADDVNGASWSTLITVTTAGNVGKYASLAVVDGNPAIAYYDDDSGDLKYVRATDATGSSWGAPVTVYGTGDVGRYASLAVVDGHPAIAYHDDTGGAAKYVRALDTTGGSWGTLVTVDSAGDAGEHISLAVVDGYPAVAYREDDGQDLRYVRALDAAGDSWESPLTVDSANNVGGYASLAVVDGRPAIAYGDWTTYDLRFAIPRKQ